MAFLGIAEAMKKFPISNCNLDHYPKCNCNRCQIYCPVGNWQANFGDTGLSKFKAEGNR